MARGGGKVDIGMDISGTICHREPIIPILESSELSEDNADEQVSDMRASESEKYLSSLLHNNAAGPALCSTTVPTQHTGYSLSMSMARSTKTRASPC